MFGKGLPVREVFDRLRMDYIDKTNLIGDSRWSDRLTYDGRWENNIYNFFTNVLPKLTFDLPRPFKLEGMERVDDTPVHKAIREAFVNMIIHADLLSEGILRIDKLDEGYIFRNPGTLRIPAAEIYSGGYTAARNTRMQNLFRMIGFGDNIGSGFPTILKAWKDENWEEPVIFEKPELNIVELHLMKKKEGRGVITHQVTEQVHSMYDPSRPQVTTQVEKLLMSINGEMTRDELIQALGLSASKNFRKLYLVPAMESGLVEMTQPNSPKSPTQKYRLTKKGKLLKEQH